MVHYTIKFKSCTKKLLKSVIEAQEAENSIEFSNSLFQSTYEKEPLIR